MPRMSRLKFTGVDTWYHLHARIAGHRGEYPLSEALPRRRLVEIIRHYASIYFCEVAAFCVMGNHYHLVVRFEGKRDVSREELEARAQAMYPGKRGRELTGLWGDVEWERYRERLFDVSELMRNVQAAFARWYNRTYDRRGRFWASRFKSVVLGEERAVLDCVLYVELNPVRAGLVERPEEAEGTSFWLREAGQDGWLVPVERLVGRRDHEAAMRELRQLLYHRGAVPTKEGQAAISREVLEREVARGFRSRGMYRKRLGYWVDGLAVGSEGFIREQLAELRERGFYRRRKNPIEQLGGVHHSLREQRSHAVVF